MTSARLEEIKKNVTRYADQAERVLEGNDDYDGADGARCVLNIASFVAELIEEIKPAE